jgi:hypothetical protein
VNAGTSITVSSGSSLIKSGFTFSSWNTVADGTGTNYAVGASLTVTENMTLYAQWYETPTIVPPAPTGLTVTPLSESSLQISWNPVPGAIMYSIYRYNSNIGAFDIITSTTSTTYTNTGLDPFRQYSYKVAAINVVGTGTLSATAASAYTQPRPLSDGVWYDQTARTTNYANDNHYYSFPVSAGIYYIQWANTAHTGEANLGGAVYGVSAYWKSNNSMTDLSTSYFTSQINGLANPRVIDAPSSGYIILKVYRSYYHDYSIRFYK